MSEQFLASLVETQKESAIGLQASAEAMRELVNEIKEDRASLRHAIEARPLGAVWLKVLAIAVTFVGTALTALAAIVATKGHP